MTENNKKRNNNQSKRSRRPQNKKGAYNKRRSKDSQSRKNKPRSKWNAHRISDHFMKRDFDSRAKDCDCGSSLRISLGLVGVIEAMRATLNKRIEIVTGYYCPDCRSKRFGIKRDFHHNGIAADIRVEGMDLLDLFRHAETYDEIKGLGISFDENHVHIDTRKEDSREVWVEKDEEWILITDENRNEFIPPVTIDTCDDDTPVDSEV